MKSKLLHFACLFLFILSCNKEEETIITSELQTEQTTYVPDNNFEQALIDLGYDDVIDNYVITNNIKLVTNLYLANKNISDLTGIQDFKALASLNVKNNLLSNLDISSNTALTELDCFNNSFTSLDIKNNSALNFLRCDRNNLKTLDVSTNTVLESLLCSGNQLTSLDVSKNTDLTNLDCSYNSLTSLDVSPNTDLIILNCISNNLKILDVSKNIALEHFTCSDNITMEKLNVKNVNNTIITFFDAINNINLSCVQVDDVNYSTTNWMDFGFPYAYPYPFSEDCF